MKNAGILAVPALLCTLYLSTELTVLGLDKFYYILAGGGKFATFPDWRCQLVIGLGYLVLQLIYLLWLFGSRSLYLASRFQDHLKSSFVFLGLAFLSYPLGNDIYIYLHSGLINLQGANPYLIRAGSFLSELSTFVDWGQTSTYGPISQCLFTLSAIALSVSPILAVYVFKIFCLILHILNGYLIWRLLQSSPERGKVTLAYLFNPLLLFEQVSSAHIDVVVSSCLILTVISLLRLRYTLTFASLWVGFLSKTLPLVWVPLVVAFLIRDRQQRQLKIIALFSLGLVILLWMTYMPGFPAWASLLNPGVTGQYNSSLHELVKFGLDWLRITSPGSLTLAQENAFLLELTRYTRLAFAFVYGLFILKTLRQQHYSGLSLVEDLAWLTLILLLFATPWVMPWYASIPLTFAAVLPGAQLLGVTSLMYALASSAQYLLNGLDGLSCLVAIGLPVLAFLLKSDFFADRSLSLAKRSTAPVQSSAQQI